MFIEDNSDDVNAVDKEEIHRSLYRLKVAFLTQRSFLQFLSVANILPGVKKARTSRPSVSLDTLTMIWLGLASTFNDCQPRAGME